MAKRGLQKVRRLTSCVVGPKNVNEDGNRANKTAKMLISVFLNSCIFCRMQLARLNATLWS